MATRGRPVEKKLPPRIDATPEQMAQAMFALPADHEWQYGPRTVYRCVDCEKAVHYPDTLYRDGRCGDCKQGRGGIVGAVFRFFLFSGMVVIVMVMAIACMVPATAVPTPVPELTSMSEVLEGFSDADMDGMMDYLYIVARENMLLDQR